MFEFFQEKAAVCGSFKDFLVSSSIFRVSWYTTATFPTAAKRAEKVSVSEQTPFKRAGYAQQGIDQKFPWDHLFCPRPFYTYCAPA